MLANLFSGKCQAAKAPTAPGLGPDENDCLHDASLESPALTAIWKSASSKLDPHEKALLEALHAAYLSRTDALRCYQTSVLQLTDQLADLRTSNAALKKQLDITSQTHASLLTELTNPGGRISSDDRAMSPVSENGEDSGWWSDSGIGAEDDTMTLAPSPSMKRGSIAGDWHRRSSSPGDVGEVKLLRKENQRMREEIQRLEGVLEDCSMVLGGL